MEKQNSKKETRGAMTTITIIDESTQGEQRAWSLDFLDETMTLRELIRRRIYQEVTEYNAKLSGCFRGLVQPTEAERALNGDGSHLKPLHKLDWQAQYEKALEAFTRRSYILLVNDKQMIDLDASIEMRAGTEVTFFKLVPLVGG
jgi:hypothetical protein